MKCIKLYVREATRRNVYWSIGIVLYHHRSHVLCQPNTREEAQLFLWRQRYHRPPLLVAQMEEFLIPPGCCSKEWMEVLI